MYQVLGTVLQSVPVAIPLRNSCRTTIAQGLALCM